MLKYIIGRPLREMEKDLQWYSKRMRDLKGNHAFWVRSVSRVIRQVYLNLMGLDNTEEPASLVGEANDGKNSKRCLEHPFLKPGYEAYECMIMTFFGYYVRQANWTVDHQGMDEFSKTNVANPDQMWASFLKAVCLYAAFRITGDKKYLKMGNQFRSKIKQWVKMGNPNVTQYDLLLDAESWAGKGKQHKALECYKAAIDEAEGRNCHHDAGLACVRLCDYHLRITKNVDEARIHFEKARMNWSKWGAHGAVEQLGRKYNSRFKQLPPEVHLSIAPSGK